MRGTAVRGQSDLDVRLLLAMPDADSFRDAFLAKQVKALALALRVELAEECTGRLFPLNHKELQMTQNGFPVEVHICSVYMSPLEDTVQGNATPRGVLTKEQARHLLSLSIDLVPFIIQDLPGLGFAPSLLPIVHALTWAASLGQFCLPQPTAARREGVLLPPRPDGAAALKLTNSLSRLWQEAQDVCGTDQHLCRLIRDAVVLLKAFNNRLRFKITCGTRLDQAPMPPSEFRKLAPSLFVEVLVCLAVIECPHFVTDFRQSGRGAGLEAATLAAMILNWLQRTDNASDVWTTGLNENLFFRLRDAGYAIERSLWNSYSFSRFLVGHFSPAAFQSWLATELTSDLLALRPTDVARNSAAPIVDEWSDQAAETCWDPEQKWIQELKEDRSGPTSFVFVATGNLGDTVWPFASVARVLGDGSVTSHTYVPNVDPLMRLPAVAVLARLA